MTLDAELEDLLPAAADDGGEYDLGEWRLFYDGPDPRDLPHTFRDIPDADQWLTEICGPILHPGRPPA